MRQDGPPSAFDGGPSSFSFCPRDGLVRGSSGPAPPATSPEIHETLPEFSRFPFMGIKIRLSVLFDRIRRWLYEQGTLSYALPEG